jgi:transposase
MMQPKIDDSQRAEFKSFWNGPRPTIVIARHFGVSIVTVHKTAERFGLPRRAHPKGPNVGRPARAATPDCVEDAEATQEPVVPVVPGGDVWTPERDAAVFRSGGAYREVSELAARWGLTSQQVLARWHRLRAV